MKQSNAKGQPLRCKFCHEVVWFDEGSWRWYDVGGETLHVDNCKLRREYYKNEARISAESRRQKNHRQFIRCQ